MSTMVVTTRITHKYLMGKSKWDLTSWIMRDLDDMDKLVSELAQARAELAAANEDAERLYNQINGEDAVHSWRCQHNRLDKGLPCNCGVEDDLQAHRDRVAALEVK